MNRFRHVRYFNELKKYVFPNKKSAIMIAVLRLAVMLLSFVPPLLYRYYIENVISTENAENLIYVILGYLALFILQAISLSAGKVIETKYVNGLRLELKRRMLDVYSENDYQFFEAENIGELRMRAENDAEVVCRFYLDHCLTLLYSTIYSIGVIIILFFLNVYLALFGSVMILLSFFITKVWGVKIEAVAKKYRSDQSEYDSMMHDALQNWKEIKLNVIEDKEAELMSEKWNKLAESKMKRARYEFAHGALMAFNLFFITRMNLFFFGGILIIKEFMTVPVMLVFMNYYEQLYTNIQTILNSSVGLRSQAPQIDKVIQTINCVYESKDIYEEITNRDIRGKLDVCNLSFTYPNSDKEVLKDVSFSMEENKSYAIVGKSGSGKTTLVKVLVGLYKPTSGRILVNQTDLCKSPDEVRNRFVNIVMQDPQFFNLSIRENLLLAKPKATEKELDNVCKLANILDFINGLDEKYDTIIGENGIKLSGGQRQRLAIARALLLKPEMLIFDEATASLDSENEKMVVNAIRGLSRFMRIVVISHRLSSIVDCDEVIIIQEGRVIAKQSLEKAQEDNKAFKEMFNKKER